MAPKKEKMIDDKAIARSLNFALQKFLIRAQTVEKVDNVIADRLEKLQSRVKQKKLKKIINKI